MHDFVTVSFARASVFLGSAVLEELDGGISAHFLLLTQPLQRLQRAVHLFTGSKHRQKRKTQFTITRLHNNQNMTHNNTNATTFKHNNQIKTWQMQPHSKQTQPRHYTKHRRTHNNQNKTASIHDNTTTHMQPHSNNHQIKTRQQKCNHILQHVFSMLVTKTT